MHKENDIFLEMSPNGPMIKSQLLPLSLPFELKSHEGFDLIVESPSLLGNPLGDSNIRHNYVLVPKNKIKNQPLILHLSGYFSTGFQNFATKTMQKNFVQFIDDGVSQKNYPQALHVFVDATTYWGGSQFINSVGSGRYSDYILSDLCQALHENFSIDTNPQSRCVMGASSGGYGALALISEKESSFGIAFAAAPDSYFEASLLHELFQAAPELIKYKKLSTIKNLISKNELQDKKSFFNLVNVIAMAHCYSESECIQEDFIELPIDLYTGELNKKIWQQWLEKDPIFFLQNKKNNLQGKEIHLDVGLYDNFSLQYGTRQIHRLLQENKVKSVYSEFPGNHFALRERKLLFLEKLKKIWSSDGE